MAEKNPPTIKVSDIGKNIGQSSLAASHIINVAKDISATAASTEDYVEKARLEGWVKELTTATGALLDSSSGTLQKVTAVVGKDADDK